MVKKAIVTAMAVISLFTLMGCNNRAEVDTLSPAQAAELKPMPQSWRGVLPCADCEGIETSLFLEKDGTWVMNERYLGAREEPSSFASYGTWARTADKLVLTDMLLFPMVSLRSPPFVRRARAGSMLIRPQRPFICVLTFGRPACQSITKSVCSPPAII